MKYSDILDEIDNMLDLDPETLTPEEQKTLDEYLDELASQESEKVDSFCKYIRALESQMEFVGNEVAYLRKKKDAIENKVDRLKGYYLQLLHKHDLKKVAGNVYSISTRNSQVVQYDGDIAALKDKYRRIKTTVEVNKTALKKDLQDGIDVKGARLVTKTSLIIR